MALEAKELLAVLFQVVVEMPPLGLDTETETEQVELLEVRVLNPLLRVPNNNKQTGIKRFLDLDLENRYLNLNHYNILQVQVR